MIDSKLFPIIGLAVALSACGGGSSKKTFREPVANELPTADFTVSPTSGKEPLTDVQFDGSRSNDTDGVVSTYAWDFGDGMSGTGRTVSHDYAAAGVYIASLVVTDNDGGSSTNASTATITVDANVPPVAVIEASPDTDQYSPAIITFDAGSSSDSDGTIDSYAWDFGDSTSDTGAVVSHTFENFGITPADFIVTLTVTDDSGSDGTAMYTVTVLPVNQNPTADFTACPITACATPDEPPFFAPYTVEFIADASNDIDGTIVQYEWDFGDGNTDLKDDPAAMDFTRASHEYLTSGSFTVELTVTDNAGAIDSFSAELTIDNLPPIAAFTATPTEGGAPLSIEFDASPGSRDPDGVIARYDWVFGDGTVGSAAVDPDTGMIDQSTVTGVGNGDGIVADHDYSNVSSDISDRSIPVDATTTIAVADLDADLKPDVVVGNNGFANHLFLSSVAMLQVNSSIDVADDLDATLDLLLQDVDGDMIADLVAANGIVNTDQTLTGQPNTVYIWDPLTSAFQAGQAIAADADVSTSVAAAYLDADANVDLVVGNLGTTNRVYLGAGGGAFAAGIDVSADVDDTSAVALADVDGDGDMDLLVANLTTRNRLYPGDGTGGFLAGFDIGSDILGSTAIALDDVDGDGDPDLVVGNGGNEQGAVNRLFLNQCDGVCAADSDVFSGDPGIDITPDAEFTTAVAFDDVDGDGDVDLVVGNAVDPTRLYLNYRNQNPDFAPPFDGVLFARRIVDNSDCDPDTTDCTCDTDNPNEEACVIENVETGIYLLEDNVSDVAIADMNGDGAGDMLIAKLDEENVLFQNTCNGACSSRDTNPYVGAFPSKFPNYNVADFAVGDVDGDGDLDMVAATPAGSMQLLHSSNDIAFGLTRYVVGSASDLSRAVVLRDMDNDGDLDLVVGNAGQVNSYYANTCNGMCAPDSNVFADSAFRYDVSSDLANTGSIAVDDVDGDGDDDLVAGNGVFGNQPNRVFMNLCVEAGDCVADTNVFDPDPMNPALTPLFFNIGGAADLRNTQSIQLGDIDLDGDLDLVVGNEDQENTYFENSCDPICAAGVNPFALSGLAIESGEARNTQSIALHDIDNDGDLDVVIGNFGSPVRLVVNDLVAPGNFSFRAGTDIGSESDSTFSVALGDVNGDGFADVVTGNDGVNRVYHSDNGAFSSSTLGINITSNDERTRVIKVFDVDDAFSDARADVVVGNSDSPLRVYYNAGAHVVRLTVTDNAGASTSTSLTINVLP